MPPRKSTFSSKSSSSKAAGLELAAELIQRCYSSFAPETRECYKIMAKAVAMARKPASRDQLRILLARNRKKRSDKNLIEYFKKKEKHYTDGPSHFHLYLLHGLELRRQALLDSFHTLRIEEAAIRAVILTSAHQELLAVNNNIYTRKGKHVQDYLTGLHPPYTHNGKLLASIFETPRNDDAPVDEEEIAQLAIKIEDRDFLEEVLCSHSYVEIRAINRQLELSGKETLIELLPQHWSGSSLKIFKHIVYRAVHGEIHYISRRIIQLDSKQKYTLEFDYLYSLYNSLPDSDIAPLKWRREVTIHKAEPGSYLFDVNTASEFTDLDYKTHMYHQILKHGLKKKRVGTDTPRITGEDLEISK